MQVSAVQVGNRLIVAGLWLAYLGAPAVVQAQEILVPVAEQAREWFQIPNQGWSCVRKNIATSDLRAAEAAAETERFERARAQSVFALETVAEVGSPNRYRLSFPQWSQLKLTGRAVNAAWIESPMAGRYLSVSFDHNASGKSRSERYVFSLMESDQPDVGRPNETAVKLIYKVYEADPAHPRLSITEILERTFFYSFECELESAVPSAEGESER